MPRRQQKTPAVRQAKREILLNKKLGELHDKYFNLVWLARKTAADEKIPIIATKTKEVRWKYPEEAKKLCVPGTTGDWQHGFHSGMLAAVRLVSAYTNSETELEELRENYEYDEPRINLDKVQAYEIENANAEFPSLDT